MTHDSLREMEEQALKMRHSGSAVSRRRAAGVLAMLEEIRNLRAVLDRIERKTHTRMADLRTALEVLGDIRDVAEEVLK